MPFKEVVGDCPIFNKSGKMPEGCIAKLGPDPYDKSVRCSGNPLLCSDPSIYFEANSQDQKKAIIQHTQT